MNNMSSGVCLSSKIKTGLQKFKILNTELNKCITRIKKIKLIELSQPSITKVN